MDFKNVFPIAEKAQIKRPGVNVSLRYSNKFDVVTVSDGLADHVSLNQVLAGATAISGLRSASVDHVVVVDNHGLMLFMLLMKPKVAGIIFVGSKQDCETATTNYFIPKLLGSQDLPPITIAESVESILGVIATFPDVIYLGKRCDDFARPGWQGVFVDGNARDGSVKASDSLFYTPVGFSARVTVTDFSEKKAAVRLVCGVEHVNGNSVNSYLLSESVLRFMAESHFTLYHALALYLQGGSLELGLNLVLHSFRRIDLFESQADGVAPKPHTCATGAATVLFSLLWLFDMTCVYTAGIGTSAIWMSQCGHKTFDNWSKGIGAIASLLNRVNVNQFEDAMVDELYEADTAFDKWYSWVFLLTRWGYSIINKVLTKLMTKEGTAQLKRLLHFGEVMAISCDTFAHGDGSNFGTVAKELQIKSRRLKTEGLGNTQFIGGKVLWGFWRNVNYVSNANGAIYFAADVVCGFSYPIESWNFVPSSVYNEVLSGNVAPGRNVAFLKDTTKYNLKEMSRLFPEFYNNKVRKQAYVVGLEEKFAMYPLRTFLLATYPIDSSGFKKLGGSKDSDFILDNPRDQFKQEDRKKIVEPRTERKKEKEKLESTPIVGNLDPRAIVLPPREKRGSKKEKN